MSGFLGNAVLRHRFARRVALLAVLVVTIPLLWFVLVDRQFALEACNNCMSCWYLVEDRVCGMTVSRTVLNQRESPKASIARDLGRPCAHAPVAVFSNRYWGLVYCFRPFSGTAALVGPNWYDKKCSAALKSWARASPGLADEFNDRAILRDDADYWLSFCRELRARAAGLKAPDKE